MRATLVPVLVKRQTGPLVEPLPDVEGVTLDGSGYGAFPQDAAWNVTHLETGVHVMYARRKRDLPAVLRALDALNLRVAEMVALRERYGGGQA